MKSTAVFLALCFLFPAAPSLLAQKPFKVLSRKDLGLSPKRDRKAEKLRHDYPWVLVHNRSGRFVAGVVTHSFPPVRRLEISNKDFTIAGELPPPELKRIEPGQLKKFDSGLSSDKQPTVLDGLELLVQGNDVLLIRNDESPRTLYKLSSTCPRLWTQRTFFLSADRIAVRDCGVVHVVDASGAPIYRIEDDIFDTRAEILRGQKIFAVKMSRWTARDEVTWSDMSSGRELRVYCLASGAEVFRKEWRNPIHSAYGGEIALSDSENVLAIAKLDTIEFYKLPDNPCSP